MHVIRLVEDILIRCRTEDLQQEKLRCCRAFQSDDIYRQIGEAVPPLFATGIALNVLIEMISSEPTGEELENSPKSIEEPVSSSYSSVIAGIKIKRKEE